jgi:hypothetical protein
MFKYTVSLSPGKQGKRLRLLRRRPQRGSRAVGRTRVQEQRERGSASARNTVYDYGEPDGRRLGAPRALREVGVSSGGPPG